MKPNQRQVLGAKIRAESEAWEKKHRKPMGGGFYLPPREVRDAHLTRVFGMPSSEISLFLTYSRTCTHAWSAGACVDCPD